MILKFTITLLGLIPFLCFGQGIDFQSLTLAEALDKAKEEGKEVFIDGYATWCGPCKRMDVTTFKDPNVAAVYNPAFVSIKLDMEKDEGMEVAEKYGVKAFPTYIYLNTQGEVLHKAAGFYDSEAFLSLAAISADTINRLGSLQRQFESGNRDQVLLDKLLEQQFQLHDPHYMKVALTIAEKETNWDTEEMRAFIFKYANSASSPLFKYMVEQKKKFYDQFGQGVTFGKIEKLVRDRSFEVEETTIDEMAQIFEMVYPQKAKELASKYRLSYYRQRGDRQNYGLAAIDHYKNFPSRDPQELNEVGSTFSRVIDDQILLKKIIPLVEKSIKIENSSYNNDTLAALHFKLGDIKAAKKAAKKAIDLAKLAGEDSTYTEELLEAIKSHSSN